MPEDETATRYEMRDEGSEKWTGVEWKVLIVSRFEIGRGANRAGRRREAKRELGWAE